MNQNIDLESIFKNGTKPSLEEVLENREKRVNFIEKLFSLYPKSTIISFKCNIPGEVKNNDTILKIFEKGLILISSQIEKKLWNSVYSKKLILNTGPEYFEAVLAPILEVKESMVLIEESNVLGRLFDIDVLYMENENLIYVERQQIGHQSRKCLVCQNDAKLCASRRSHSISEIHNEMIKLIKKDLNIK